MGRSMKNMVRDILIPLIMGIGCAGVLLFATRTRMFQFIELKTYDFMIQKKAALTLDIETFKKGSHIVIISIDDATLKELRDPMIFWKPHLAKIIEMLKTVRAKVVGIDYIPSVDTSEYLEKVMKESSDGKPLAFAPSKLMVEYEQILARAIAGGKVVLIASPGEEKWIKPLELYIHAAGIDNLSMSNSNPDVDGVVRQQLLYLEKAGESLPGFSLLLASLFLDKKITSNDSQQIILGDTVIPGEDPQSFIINYRGPPKTFPNVSFIEVLKKVDDLNWCSNLFKDRIVLIGCIYSGFLDFHPTPFSSFNLFRSLKDINEMAGVEIVANATETLIKSNFIRKGKGHLQKLLIFLLCVFFSLLLYKLTPIKGLFLIISSCLLSFLVCFFYLYRCNLWIDTAALICSQVLVYTAIFPYRYLVVDAEQNRTRRILERYVSRAVAQELLRHPENLRLGGEIREVTILFSDINDFTTLSEIKEPEELVSALNEYFALMEEIIFKNRGTLEKYVGDEIMVLFGAPLYEKDHRRLAVITAMEMMKELEEWKKKREEQGKFSFHIKIGIHSGKAILGNIGSLERTQYTAIGDCVNLAARIMGLNKLLGTDILISEDTYSQCTECIEAKDMGLHSVKGRKQQVRLYNPTGFKGELKNNKRRGNEHVDK